MGKTQDGGGGDRPRRRKPRGFEGPNLSTAWLEGERIVGREEERQEMLPALEARSEAAGPK